MLFSIIIFIKVVETKISLDFNKVEVLVIVKVEIIINIIIIVDFKSLRIYLN